MFRYLDAFADYDPLKDNLPDSLYWELGYIEQQAIFMLPVSFTIVDLNAGLEILFQLKKFKPRAIYKYQESLQEIEKYSGIFHSTPLDYFLCTEHTEPGVLPNGRPFPWSWLFAVLALASISDYVAVHHKVYEFDPKETRGIDSALQNNSGQFEMEHKHELPIEAMEALGFARLFAERENQGERQVSKQKEKGRKVSETKLKNIHPLKEAVISCYLRLDKPIKDRKAAEIIETELDEDVKLLSSSSDLRQQIQIWLSQYRRGVLPGQESLPAYQS